MILSYSMISVTRTVNGQWSRVPSVYGPGQSALFANFIFKLKYLSKLLLAVDSVKRAPLAVNGPSNTNHRTARNSTLIHERCNVGSQIISCVYFYHHKDTHRDVESSPCNLNGTNTPKSLVQFFNIPAEKKLEGKN